MRTLQTYVTRELLKTFGLAAVGLTLTFSLCGGVLNMVQADVLTGMELIRLLGFVLPVAMTLTLPVAALFACAMVYGRLAADNEFDACKSSGIDIQWLLAPAVGLSVFTAVFTFVFSNYVIPNTIARLEAMVREDSQHMAAKALGSNGYLRYRRKNELFVLHAGRSSLIETDRETDVLSIRDAAFLELKNGKLERCGTADEIRVDFRAEGRDGIPEIEAVMYDFRAFDVDRKRILEEHERPIGSKELPSQLEHEPKWLTLRQLIHYRTHTTDLPVIQNMIAKIRLAIRDNLFYRHVNEQLTGGEQVLRLSDAQRQYEIWADAVEHDREDFHPELQKVTVRHSWQDPGGKGRQRLYEADRCEIHVRKGVTDGQDRVAMTLRDNVKFVDSLDADQPIERNRMELEQVAVPADVLGREQTITDDELIPFEVLRQTGVSSLKVLNEKLPSLGLGDEIRMGRIKTLVELLDLRYEIVGVIHSRLAFSVSALVMLVLAAALGIVFRGGQLLTAFVISFVPGLVVVVMNIMGRHTSENPGTHMLGLALIWAGIGLLAVVDGVVLTRYLKR